MGDLKKSGKRNRIGNMGKKGIGKCAVLKVCLYRSKQTAKEDVDYASEGRI